MVQKTEISAVLISKYFLFCGGTAVLFKMNCGVEGAKG
jgi:hypothetical protein